MSLVKFVPRYFILFDAIVNGIVFLIFLSDGSLLVYRNTTDFCILISYSSTLLNLFIWTTFLWSDVENCISKLSLFLLHRVIQRTRDMVATNTLFPQCFLIPCGLLRGQLVSQPWLNLVWVSLGLYNKVWCLSYLLFWHGIEMVVLKSNSLSSNFKCIEDFP